MASGTKGGDQTFKAVGSRPFIINTCMKSREILEYSTKGGDEITTKRHEDVEGDNNRGWRVDKIAAYVDGDYAGYIKISYIPKERFIKYYPTVLNYMSQIGGSGGVLPRGKNNWHYRELSDEELKNTVQNLSGQTKYHSIWNSGGKEGMPSSRDELIYIINDIIKNERKGQEAQENFKKFAKYWIDKPIVDFIKVFKKDESRFDRSTGDRTIKNSSRDYQRQRIGTALYLEAGEWLRERGLKLYASGTQTKEAQAAWNNLEKMNRVGQEGDRRFLKI